MQQEIPLFLLQDFSLTYKIQFHFMQMLPGPVNKSLYALEAV